MPKACQFQAGFGWVVKTKANPGQNLGSFRAHRRLTRKRWLQLRGESVQWWICSLPKTHKEPRLIKPNEQAEAHVDVANHMICPILACGLVNLVWHAPDVYLAATSWEARGCQSGRFWGGPWPAPPCGLLRTERHRRQELRHRLPKLLTSCCRLGWERSKSLVHPDVTNISLCF